MAKGTLGPFPKTRRWAEIVAEWIDRDQAAKLSDLQLCRLKAELEQLTDDADALKAVIFWVALPIATRSDDPVQALKSMFGIEAEGPGKAHLLAALDTFLPEESLAKAAARATLNSVDQDPALFPKDPWGKWRSYDSSNFCNLAFRFYENLNRQYFQALLEGAPPAHIETLAREMAIITRTFSARWFNACAREETPSRNSIRWYFGHCLGKLDLEASREMSDWVEQPRKRKGEPEPSLFEF